VTRHSAFTCRCNAFNVRCNALTDGCIAIDDRCNAITCRYNAILVLTKIALLRSGSLLQPAYVREEDRAVEPSVSNVDTSVAGAPGTAGGT
jgi:hypothetical protein